MNPILSGGLVVAPTAFIHSDYSSAARDHGLDRKLVADIRNAGIEMAMEADGRPISEEAWARAERRWVGAGKLSSSQFRNLRHWFRTQVEGGGQMAAAKRYDARAK